MLLVTLCKTVNQDNFGDESKKVVLQLMQSHGSQAILVLCRFLESPKNTDNINNLQAAIYFISLSTWGSKRVASLRIDPMQILPSMFLVCFLLDTLPLSYLSLLVVATKRKLIAQTDNQDDEILFSASRGLDVIEKTCLQVRGSDFTRMGNHPADSQHNKRNSFHQDR